MRMLCVDARRVIRALSRPHPPGMRGCSCRRGRCVHVFWFHNAITFVLLQGQRWGTDGGASILWVYRE
jgi:hypothetical protein